jgi:hypothetical protein
VRFDESVPVRYSGCAGWSSLVARRAHNPKVVSSNLTPATNFQPKYRELVTTLTPVFFLVRPNCLLILRRGRLESIIRPARRSYA